MANINWRRMGFFDFIGGLEGYDVRARPDRRMNARHAMLIGRHTAQIAGARVLDLAAHDGRWSYAFAAAGATQVVGIEARADLIARFAHFPDAGLRARVDLRCADIHDAMAAEVASGHTYDVVAVFGIFYHIMDHFRLLRDIRALRPRFVILDGEFVWRTNPVIQLVHERTDNPLNAVAQVPGQQMAIKGVPSIGAVEAMARALAFRTEWLDWNCVPPPDRAGLADYFRDGRMRRGTCCLTPLPDVADTTRVPASGPPLLPVQGY